MGLRISRHCRSDLSRRYTIASNRSCSPNTRFAVIIKSMEHVIRQYSLEPGALEAQYIEEYFTEFRQKKTAEEIINRLKDREHLILLSMAPSEDEDGVLIPVGYKIGHELRAQETNIKLSDL